MCLYVCRCVCVCDLYVSVYMYLFVFLYFLVCSECTCTCSGTCVLRTPLERRKVSRLSSCSDFPGDKVPFGALTECVDYAGVLIFKCPR